MTAPNFDLALGSWTVATGVDDDQVSAAVELRKEHLPGWHQSARAVYEIGERLPSVSPAHVLGKVAAVDGLYNARLDGC